MLRVLAAMSPEDREKLARIIGQFAPKLVDHPVPEREGLISSGMSRLRDTYRERYADDAEALKEAMAFLDALEGWTRETVDAFEDGEDGEPG